ncbi:hypothetical protein CITRIK5_50196 [Citricoccus sp. K5]|nr:hypothetical protein CITRIK5_50196 [Citricoccus sp. K5]
MSTTTSDSPANDTESLWETHPVTPDRFEDFAASRGAPAVEAYPVVPAGRMDLTMAFVGTRSMFENPVMRRELT